MKIHEIYYGFELLKHRHIKEIKADAYEFQHIKSGARLLFLDTDDDNKVFSITFRTPPTDDTGAAHIVEHSTLCGSRKYPLKEPFVELVKGSLNTFLNAMTYPDKTMYPVASRNDKDFQNLMDVYLDAVFYPAMRDNPQVLMQEGWHYEIKDPSEPLKYSGVVYNEMKGALSDPDDLLESKILSTLYPHTPYRFESGGNPEAIPELTQEKFVAFHSKYYHPSNSYIYLYGKMDILDKLRYLDEEYLCHFNCTSVSSGIETEPSFPSLQEADEEYPIGESESTEEKTYLALSFAFDEAMDTETVLALNVLNHALLISDAAPLRQALVDVHFGKDISSSLELDLKQPHLSIVVQQSEKDRAKNFYEYTMKEIRKLAEGGINHTLLNASLNLFEFKLREADFGTAPKGLIYNIWCMRSWLYDRDPLEYLYYEDAIENIRHGLEHGYFEKLLHRCFLDNKHLALITLSPSTTVAGRKQEQLSEKLDKIKQSMSRQKLEQTIASTRALKLRQETPETPEALKTIPVLKREDISLEPESLPLEESREGDITYLYSKTETNGIGYLSLYFDASSVAQSDLLYLYLLSDILGSVDTKTYGYQSLANQLNLHTGGLSIDLVPYTRKNEPDSFLPKFRIRSKALHQKIPEMIHLITLILTESVFDNKKRLKELLEEEQSSIESSFQRTAHSLVAASVNACFTPSGAYAYEGLLPFYHFVKELLKDYDKRYPEIQQAFDRIMTCLFQRHRLILSLTGDDEICALMKHSLKELLNCISQEEHPVQPYHFELKKTTKGFQSSSSVQYVGKGANFEKLGFSYSGTMHVLETLLRYGYFWTRIRVQGGAYGAFTNFNRNGKMFFGSYRDPHLEKTLEVFDQTADFLRNFDMSDREMNKTIIGTMSGVDIPLTPKMKGENAAALWIRNISYEDRKKARREILTTTQQDIRNLASMIDACMKEGTYCVYGNENKIVQKNDLFDEIIKVME